MAAPSVTARDVTVKPVRDIEIEDSCNCCWGGSSRKMRQIEKDNRDFLKEKERPAKVKDIDDVLRLKIEVDIPSPQEKRRSHDHKHARAPTTYPKADESIRSANTDPKA